MWCVQLPLYFRGLGSQNGFLVKLASGNWYVSSVTKHWQKCECQLHTHIQYLHLYHVLHLNKFCNISWNLCSVQLHWKENFWTSGFCMLDVASVQGAPQMQSHGFRNVELCKLCKIMLVKWRKLNGCCFWNVLILIPYCLYMQVLRCIVVIRYPFFQKLFFSFLNIRWTPVCGWIQSKNKLTV